MILTTKGRYAVMAVIEVADNKEDKPLSLATISKRQNISLSYLEQIFARLRREGIVKSIKGPGGGYILGRDSSQITASQVIKAIGETIKMTRCATDKGGCVTKSAKCKTHSLWRGLEDSIYQYLDSITLQDLCK